MQDAGIAETNQRGLGALPHEAGVLLPEEYEVFAFQQWVRDQL
jgi:Rieske 2Fe-2S family protein